MGTESHYILALQITSIFSVTLSLVIIFTLLCFRSMRSKVMMQMIAYIAASNIIGDFPYMFPYRPGTGNPWCSAQAFLHLSGPTMAWMWTTVVTYCLFVAATKKVMPVDEMRYYHIFCWGIPIIMTLSSLGFSNYGRNEEMEDFELCSFRGSSESVAIFHFALFYGVLVLCFICSLYWKYRLHSLDVNHSYPISKDSFRIASSALRRFPLAMFVCYTPRAVVVLIALFRRHGLDSNDATLASLIMKISYGVVCAAIFFRQSREARLLWSKALSCCFASNVQPSISTSTVNSLLTLDDLMRSALEENLREPSTDYEIGHI